MEEIMKFLYVSLVAIIVIGFGTIGKSENIEYVSSLFWREINDLVADSNYLYCAYSSGLAILDTSHPDSLRLWLEMPVATAYVTVSMSPFCKITSGELALIPPIRACAVRVSYTMPPMPTAIAY
jgi:hypothetical protein